MLFEYHFPHILCRLRLLAVNSGEVFRVAERKGCLFETRLLDKLPQVDVVRLVVPNVLLLVGKLREREWNRGGIAISSGQREFLHGLREVLSGEHVALAVAHHFLRLLQQLNHLGFQVRSQEVSDVLV
jgi:hypothetical protein